MNEDLQEQRGESPTVPPWVRFGDPAEASRAAHAAWLHAPTRCVLLKLWYPCGCGKARCGEWLYRVVHPCGVDRVAAKTYGPSTRPEEQILDAAALAVAQIEADMQQGG